jgi:ferric-dicitrate binding protein FerR (iron transport regulator)
MELLAQSENEGEVQELLGKVIENTEAETTMPDEAAASVLQNILQTNETAVLPGKRKSVFISWTRVAAAAGVILFISAAAYWVLSEQNNGKLTASAVVPMKQAATVLPGGNHAMLTIGDGSTIVLDSINNGNIQRGGVTINKQGGLLVYAGSLAAKAHTAVVYNTLTTPRGGQYKVVLADGTRVWLNASSSLHFPTAFTGKERNVELTGEAYFEVAGNKEKPFHVNVNGIDVEVLGTHFNINAYADETAVKTTLLEGSVRVVSGGTAGLLRPGEQGVLNKKGTGIEIKKVDMNEVIAWKNGLFQFDGADIKSIMRQIGRWYDVEIEYSGEVSKRRFEGKISRDAQLSDVLKILELSNVKFSVEGKRIVVQ